MTRKVLRSIGNRSYCPAFIFRKEFHGFRGHASIALWRAARQVKCDNQHMDSNLRISSMQEFVHPSGPIHEAQQNLFRIVNSGKKSKGCSGASVDFHNFENYKLLQQAIYKVRPRQRRPVSANWPARRRELWGLRPLRGRYFGVAAPGRQPGDSTLSRQRALGRRWGY